MRTHTYLYRSAIFFVRNLIAPLDFLGFGPLDQVIQGCGAAALVLIATLLASRIPLSVRQLRLVELVLFGVLAFYFAWLQNIMFREGRVLQWAKEGDEFHVIRLANASNLLDSLDLKAATPPFLQPPNLPGPNVSPSAISCFLASLLPPLPALPKLLSGGGLDE